MNAVRYLRNICLAVLCVLPLLLSGCRDDSEQTETQQEISSSVLKVAFEGMTVPCNWTQDNAGNGAVPIHGSRQYLCGFEIAYMKKLCALAGLTLEAYKFDWDGMLMAVSTGKVDCAVSMIAPTPERARSMDFTTPYYYGETVAVVKKETPYASAKSMEDLKLARGSAMLNTLWYTEMLDRVPDVRKQPALENVPALIVALQAGKTDFILLDRPTAEGIIIANPDLVILPFSGVGVFNLTREETACAIALPKGRDDLRKTLEAAIAKIPQEDVARMVEEACRNQPLNLQR